jgi:hypothetical protein
MGKRIEDLVAPEAKAAEEAELTSDPGTPLPFHVEVTRGHPRARNLQVRFREDEFDELAAYAEQCGLPVSTVVRSLVLQAIAPADDLKSALDKLETDWPWFAQGAQRLITSPSTALGRRDGDGARPRSRVGSARRLGAASA